VYLTLGLLGCRHAGEQGAATPGLEPASRVEEPAVPGADSSGADSTSTYVDPEPVEAGVGHTNAPTRGTLPVAVIEDALVSAGPGIEACYERALEKNPALVGNLNINFVVAPDGKVEYAEASEVEQPLSDPSAVECVLSVIRKLEFPEPRGGKVFINYPLKFERQKTAP
jgi:hypothetical protein